MAKKISYIVREGPSDHIGGLEDGLLADLREDGVGRVMDINFVIDDVRGRAIIDIVGEVCEGEIALHIFTGGNFQESANSWIAEEGLGDLKAELVRADGRVYLLLVGRKE
ncbi:MAG: hypothetical protein WAP23_02375 [Candidatus Spechtbacterales bacterium]